MKLTTIFNPIIYSALAGPLLVSSIYAAGLDYLSANAAAVVVGSVNSRIEGPNQVSFALNIARVLVGTDPGSSTVQVSHEWAGTLRASETVAQTLSGMWFLTKKDSGDWDVIVSRPSQGVRTVLSLFLPSLLTPPGANSPFAYSAGTSPLDALVYEVAAGVQSSPAATPDADPTIILDAFGSLDTTAVQSVLTTGLRSGNPGFQAVALAAALGLGLPGAIQQLVQLWPTIANDTHATYVASVLRNSWRDPAPAGIAQLGSVVAAEPAGTVLHGAAIKALAAIHTAETLPLLAGLLSSADPDEQAQAIYGLSAFANGCPTQGPNNVVSMAYLQCDQPSTYRTPETFANFGFSRGTAAQEANLAAFWQSWWSSHAELH
jgi:hypothetical protein